MGKSKTLSKRMVILCYLLAILIFAIALVALLASSILGILWVWPILGLVFSLVLFWLISKTPKANEILSYLEIMLPSIEKIQIIEARKTKYYPLIKKIEYIINHYNLGYRFGQDKTSDDYFAFTDDFYKSVAGNIPHTKSIDDALRICVSEVTKMATPPITDNVLLTLYLPVEQEEAMFVYAEIKKSKPDLENLADILDQSEQLPPKTLLPYSKKDIVLLLKNLNVFSLKELREEFESLQNAWEIVAAYREFLTINEIISQDYSVTINDLLKTDRFNIQDRSIVKKLDAQNKQIITGLTNIGKKTLGQTYIDKSLNNIAMAMFITEMYPTFTDLTESTCRLAAQTNTTVKMVFAYIELRERSRKENKFVSVEEVSTQWQPLNNKRKEEVSKGYERDLEVIRNKLLKGVWPTRLQPIAIGSFDKVGEDLGQQTQRMEKVAQNRPDAKNALRRVFDSLSINTIERFLEARTIIAYLLTFNAQEGFLANLIDSLVKRKPEKYHLAKYIKQCRIGLVPSNTTFQSFCSEFERDLIQEYKALGNGHIKDFEMIVHRFGLAERDRYDFDKFNHNAQKKKAEPNIKLLLGDNLDIDGLVKAAGYEFGTDAAGIEKLISLMLDEKISRLVDQQVGGLNTSEKNYLDEYCEKWKIALAEEYGYNGQFIPFAKNLVQPVNLQDRKDSLAKLINDDPNVPQSLHNPVRCQNIANFYIDTITDIASVA